MSLLPRLSLYLIVLSTGLIPSICSSAEGDPLPEVLTLERALERASGDHPDLLIARSEVDKARAEQLSADAYTGLESQVTGQLRWIDPPDIAYDQDRGDHKLSLFANKRLYDFGYSASLEEAAEAGLTSKEYLYSHAMNKHRIAIMTAYFDVLLADQKNTRDREEMTVAYLKFDKARDRHELGMLSEIDLLELESISQAKLVLFRQSGYQQHSTRTNLADVLNMPGAPPDELEMPELKSNNRAIPDDVTEWLAIAEKQNPLLLAMQARLTAAERRMESARNVTNPVLTGQVELSKYARESGSYDNWRAGVTLDIPLSTSGKSEALVASSRAELLKAQAELEQQRRNLRQALLELWNELKTLQVEKQSVEALMNYRDLYLDRSRAIYQMEVKADLGDAEAKIMDAKLQEMQNRFAVALTWARVEAMLGVTVYSGEELEPQTTQEVKP